MRISPRIGRVAAVLTVFVLLVAACGDGGEIGNAEPLPPNDNPTDTPSAAGTCAEGEPDCNDTPGIGEEPIDLPDDGTVSPLGMPADGGLTIADALASDATGTIAVQGFLVDNGTTARLCEALAESYPPQCGGPSIPVVGFEEMIDVPLAAAQGVTWTDEYVTLFGEIIDGTFVVDATVAG